MRLNINKFKNIIFLIKILLLFPLFHQNIIFALGSNGLARSPIVGIIQNNQVPILVKGTAPGNVRIEYHEVNNSVSKFTEWGSLSFGDDLTTNLILNEINYNTEYTYRVMFSDGSNSKWFTFSAFPQQSQPGEFSFIFSACVRDKYLPHNIFDYVSTLSPTFVALLGDNIYADSDGDINIGPPYSVLPALRGKYVRNFDEHFQAVSSNIPIVAIWDDHDYGQDNSDSTYRYKEETKKVFKESFPIYPFQVENEGIYYQFKIADIDFFVLDTRWYRTPMDKVDNNNKTMLGEEQLSWLLNGLKLSTAPFKIIFSSVSMNDYGGDTSSDKAGFDSWMGYTFERDKILSFIEDNKIDGVMVFSGDQHYPSAHILNWNVPLNSVSQTDTSIVYSLSDLNRAVFDFSSSGFHNRRATGRQLILGNQNNPFYSFEVFRAAWGHPPSGNQITSVYGLVNIDTRNSTKIISVTFYELDLVNGIMIALYNITVTRDNLTTVNSQSIKIPSSFLIEQNFPNPFNGETNIIYSLSESRKVELTVYDVLGTKIITLVNDFQNAGEYKVTWNGKNSYGTAMASGIYFYRITVYPGGNKGKLWNDVKGMVYLK
ncbi:MAG: alkaline phosphatase D family protein [Bacteroidetes bacterium]|nr:alkaline phosphatase D family protein [Bacteroidota bacterium]